MRLIESFRVNCILHKLVREPFMKEKLNELKAHSQYTFKHSINVACECLHIGINLKLSKTELEDLGRAALLHDIGKIRIPLNILDKEGKLTTDEFLIIKRHPIYGFDIVRESTCSERVRSGVMLHHENNDGSGYYGFEDESIPLIPKIIRIADTYDAMTDNRVYQQKRSSADALSEMSKNKAFDKNIFDIFRNEKNKGKIRKNKVKKYELILKS